jgi:hypothetical protein
MFGPPRMVLGLFVVVGALHLGILIYAACGYRRTRLAERGVRV